MHNSQGPVEDVGSESDDSDTSDSSYEYETSSDEEDSVCQRSYRGVEFDNETRDEEEQEIIEVFFIDDNENAHVSSSNIEYAPESADSPDSSRNLDVLAPCNESPALKTKWIV